MRKTLLTLCCLLLWSSLYVVVVAPWAVVLEQAVRLVLALLSHDYEYVYHYSSGVVLFMVVGVGIAAITWFSIRAYD